MLVFPRVAVASQGRAGCLRAWLCRWSRVLRAAGWSSAGLQSRMRRSEVGRSSIGRASAFPLACCSLPYEWRPLWPSIRGLTPESGLRLQGLLPFQRCILVIRCLSKLSIESSHPATPLFLFIRFFGCRPALTGERVTSAPDAFLYPLLRVVGCRHFPLFKSIICQALSGTWWICASQGADSGAQTGS